MLRIQPFSALRPQPDLAARVASVPYDVVSTEEARALARDNPLSFLRVVRSELEQPAGTNPFSAEVYAGAKAAFERLQREALVREEAPGVYLYRQEMTLFGNRLSQTGVVACCHVDDYERGVIKRHEKTRKEKEDDRTRHVLSLRANTGPVFLMHRDQPQVAARVQEDATTQPLYDFEAPDGVRHTIWRVSDPQSYVESFSSVECAYVADGHHRSASAARAAAQLRQENPAHSGKEEYNWFLSVLFPASALTVLPYHRVVRDLAGHTAQGLLERLGQTAQVTPTTSPTPSHPGEFGMYLEGRWFHLQLPALDPNASDAVSRLDYSRLYDEVLSPILGIGDIRTDKRVDFVGGIRGAGELARRVDSGQDAVAFFTQATPIADLFGVADAGQIMPPKSTWFEPKLRSGLLVHTLD